MYIQFAKTSNSAKIPSKRLNDAGFDIYATKEKSIIIMPHETVMISTGLRSIIEPGYYVQIQERGSTGSKGIKYGAGVIDSNYRGEWFLATTNTNTIPIVITNEEMPDYAETMEKLNHLIDYLIGLNNNVAKDYITYDINKAIFQGIVHKVPDTQIQEVNVATIDNAVTDRGTGKLGSSGK